MKSVALWQKALKEAAEKKFPKANWSQFDRVASIQRQLDDVVVALKVEVGMRKSSRHGHQDPDHRIAALIADVLILAAQRNADIEQELEKVLLWFRTLKAAPAAPPSRKRASPRGRALAK